MRRHVREFPNSNEKNQSRYGDVVVGLSSVVFSTLYTCEHSVFMYGIAFILPLLFQLSAAINKVTVQFDSLFISGHYAMCIHTHIHM